MQFQAFASIIAEIVLGCWLLIFIQGWCHFPEWSLLQLLRVGMATCYCTEVAGFEKATVKVTLSVFVKSSHC